MTQLFPTHVVVESINGVGYEIQTPNSYRFQKYLEKELVIYTSLIVREDAQLLYGFINEEEKDMFLSLIKVTGIGPKSALAILATSTPNEVKMAIENENDAYLTKFPGIGKNCTSNCARFKRQSSNYKRNNWDTFKYEWRKFK